MRQTYNSTLRQTPIRRVWLTYVLVPVMLTFTLGFCVGDARDFRKWPKQESAQDGIWFGIDDGTTG